MSYELRDYSRDEQLKMIDHHPLYLQYINNQIEEICIIAVKREWRVLQYVKDQAPSICLAAIETFSSALYYMREQTPEMCLAAVRKSGWTLEGIKDQTEEMCLIAVRQYGGILSDVRKQTERICLAAVRQDVDAHKHIKDPKAYVSYLVENDLFTTEALRDDQKYREFLMEHKAT